MNKLIVLGIDPSFTNMGLCVGDLNLSQHEIGIHCLEVLHLQLVSTEVQNKKSVRKSSDDLRRAKELHTELQNVISVYKPHIIFTEVPSGSQSAVAAKGLGIAVGVLASITQPLIQVSQLEVKLASIGKKTASKDEIIQWAINLYPEAPWLKHNKKLVAKNEHIADSVAVINAGIATEEFKSLMVAFKAAHHHIKMKRR
jgi:Holliday junction resolvasome RuvABC endonuclease subunit